MLGQLLEGFFGQLFVGHGQEAIAGFQHRDLGTQTGPDTAQLQTDDARADHAQTCRNSFKIECTPGVDDALAVQRHRLQRHGHRTTGQHNVFG